jgi:hypothetical protein
MLQSSTVFVKFVSERNYHTINIPGSSIACNLLKDHLMSHFRLNPITVQLVLLTTDRLTLNNDVIIPSKSFLLVKRLARNLPRHVEFRLRRIMTQQQQRKQRESQRRNNKQDKENQMLDMIVQQEKENWIPDSITELFIDKMMKLPEPQQRKSTAYGVPQENLKQDDDGLFVNADGDTVSLIPSEDCEFNHNVRQVSQKKQLHNESNTTKIPRELTCGLCRNLVHECVQVPCCNSNYCNHCILNYLSRSENKCPNCKQKICIDELIINKATRFSVDKFILTGKLIQQQQTIPVAQHSSVTTNIVTNSFQEEKKETKRQTRKNRAPYKHRQNQYSGKRRRDSVDYPVQKRIKLN